MRMTSKTGNMDLFRGPNHVSGGIGFLIKEFKKVNKIKAVSF